MPYIEADYENAIIQLWRKWAIPLSADITLMLALPFRKRPITVS